VVALDGGENLIGSAHADRLNGDNSDNLLEGGAGADTLNGNGGSDTAGYAGSDAGVNVSLLTGWAGGGHAAGDSLAGIENLAGSAHADILSGDGGANLLRGGGGDDLLRGRGGADALEGGAGSDTASYDDSAGWVNVSLASGFAGGGSGSHAIGDTFDSIENLTGSRFADRLNGDDGDNLLEGGAGADTLDGNGGSDTASYAGSAGWVNVSLLTGFTGGGSGNHARGDRFEQIENLRGSAFGDRLNGDNGANRIEGGAGDDTLAGNGGADLFVFAEGFGADQVLDFEDGTDLLDFSGHAGVGGTGDLTITASGADAVVADGLGNSVTLVGAAGLIAADDFVF